MFLGIPGFFYYLAVALIVCFLSIPAWILLYRKRKIYWLDFFVPFVSTLIYFLLMENCNIIYRCQKTLANIVELIYFIPLIIILLTYSKTFWMKKSIDVNGKINLFYYIVILFVPILVFFVTPGFVE